MVGSLVSSLLLLQVGLINSQPLFSLVTLTEIVICFLKVLPVQCALGMQVFTLLAVDCLAHKDSALAHMHVQDSARSLLSI